MKEFQDKVVAVTGAASGIGKAIALEFARLGARLALADIDAEGLGRIEDEISAIGCGVYSQVVDVSVAQQVGDFCDQTYREMGRVDILCNNAGCAVFGLVEEVGLEDWEWILGVNLWGVIYGCHYFYPRMIAQGGGGHIVNTASAAALGSLAMQAPYCCTKYGVRALSESMRGEAALHGIGVSTICPGFVTTNIASTMKWCIKTEPSKKKQLMERSQRLLRWRNYPPDRVASAVRKAVERNSVVVTVGPEAHLLDIVNRLSRTISYRWLRSNVKWLRRLF